MNGLRSRTGTPADWLFVGLCNPGADYAGTRHNVGAEVVELLAGRWGQRLKAGKERALVGEVVVDGVRVALGVPQTFMNLSGESLRLLAKRYGITDPSRIVVFHDELDLPTARVKLKTGGGTAGHNGLKSVQAHLGTADFQRVRIGIGRPPGRQQVADYVLKRPGKSERVLLDVAIAVAADCAERILAVGIDRAMNETNTAAT